MYGKPPFFHSKTSVNNKFKNINGRCYPPYVIDNQYCKAVKLGKQRLNLM